MAISRLELYEITVGHTGLICKFKGNPYNVFIDVPGAAAMAGRGHPKLLFGGTYDPKEVIQLLKTIPMYNRANTVFTTENVVITYTKKYARISKEAVPGVSPARKSTIMRFNKLPIGYVPHKRGREHQPPTWLF